MKKNSIIIAALLLTSAAITAMDTNLYLGGKFTQQYQTQFNSVSKSNCMVSSPGWGGGGPISWTTLYDKSTFPALNINPAVASKSIVYATPKSSCTEPFTFWLTFTNPNASGSEAQKILANQLFQYTPATNTWQAGPCFSGDSGQQCDPSYFKVTQTKCSEGIKSANCFALSGTAVDSSASSSSDAVKAPAQALAQKSAFTVNAPIKKA